MKVGWDGRRSSTRERKLKPERPKGGGGGSEDNDGCVRDAISIPTLLRAVPEIGSEHD